jgi:arsenite-transporting ATPase
VVATDLYGEAPGDDPTLGGASGELLSVAAEQTSDGEQEFVLTMLLPLAARGDVDASRSGDELVVTVAGHRRVLTLPSVLRRCQVAGGTVADGRLVLRFRPDPGLWPTA